MPLEVSIAGALVPGLLLVFLGCLLLMWMFDTSSAGSAFIATRCTRRWCGWRCLSACSAPPDCSCLSEIFTMNKPLILRLLITIVVIAVAVLLGHTLWKHYLYAPWT